MTDTGYGDGASSGSARRWTAWCTRPGISPGATRRAMRAIRPDLLVLEYTEIWPNLIHAARAPGARVVLTNGRFSPERLGPLPHASSR